MAKKKSKINETEEKQFKIYRMYGINTAIEMLRPGAKWEWTGGVGFSRWDDPRPKPSQEEVMETMEKIKAFEDSVNTVWTEEQIQHLVKDPFIAHNNGLEIQTKS